MQRLAGRIVLVTGAPAGAGPAICRRLAAEGAWVAVNFRRDLEGAKRLVDQLRSDGGRAMLVPGDVALPAQAWAVLERVDLSWGPTVIVVEQSGAETDEGAKGQDPGARMATFFPPRVRLDAAASLVSAITSGRRQSQLGRHLEVDGDASAGVGRSVPSLGARARRPRE